MEESIRECLKLALSCEKISIREYEECLKNKNKENKEKFLNSYLHYVFSSVYKVYTMFKDEFNGFYDFNDLFYDAILVATKLYDQWYFDNEAKNYYNFFNFTNYFRLYVLRLSVNTYFVKIGEPAFLKYVMIKRTKEGYLKDKGYLPNSDELEKMFGYSKREINHIKTCDSLENHSIGYSTFEDDLIDQIDYESLIKTILKARGKLRKRSRVIFDEYFGFEDNSTNQTMRSIGQKYGISQQGVFNSVNNSIKKIKKLYPELSDF